MKKYTFAIIGAGNGGQAFAAYVAHQGHSVRLFDFFDETVTSIKKKGVIQLTGDINVTAKVDYVGNNIEKAILDADVIMIVNPSIYHDKIAKEIAPFLKKGQQIFLNPSSTFGSFAFKKSLENYGYKEKVTISESATLLFACRAIEPGVVNIGGQKDRLLISTFPACETQSFYDIIKEIIPRVVKCSSVLETGFDNTNPMVHPMPTMMNVNWIESGKPFKYYWEGIGETLGGFIEKMDKERIAIAEHLGLKLGDNLYSLFMQFKDEYRADGETLPEVFRNVSAYENIFAPNSIRARYIYEDVPTALLPLAELGDALGLETKHLRTVINLCELMLNENFTTCETARTLKSLGLDGMSREEIKQFAILGEK